MAAKHFKSEPARFGSGGATAPRSSRPVRKRPFVIGALALAVVSVAVTGVVAWLTVTGQINNQFELGVVDPVVNEDGPTSDEPFKDGDKVKQNVDVTNKGNIPIYVRAQVSIHWIDADGNQLWEEPEEGADYTVERGTPSDSSWQKGPDGFYYWTSPLPAGETTGLLINKIEYTATQTNRQLVCDIAVQGIQADPAAAVEEAWGVEVGTDGALVVNGQQGQQGGE